jgi:CheY-like chemotaxis protein
MKHRILIVDDELNYLFVMKHMLRDDERFEVRTSYLASQALFVARDFKPNLILLDCMMPGMDGGELAGTLQADPLLKDTPFLFLTCTVSDVEQMPSKCYSGMQTYVPKNIDFEELLKLIESKLGVQPKPPAAQTA